MPTAPEMSDTALYTASLVPREASGGWWKSYKIPRIDKAEFKSPDLPYDMMEIKAEGEGTALKRYIVTLKCAHDPHTQDLGLSVQIYCGYK